ncbi:MAG: hypothetical protein ACRDJK_10075, partial [Actinomycetota bacterium]
DGPGGGGDWTFLTTAGNQVEAHLIVGRLAEEGIESVLDSSNPAPGAWLHPFGNPLSPVRVFVRRRDLGRASLLLHEVDHRPPDPGDPGPPRARRLFWLVLAVVILLAVLEVLDFAPCVLRLFCL